MTSLICRECGCPIASTSPFHSPNVQTQELCTECLYWGEENEEIQGMIENAVRRGTLCHLCFKPLAPPGGTTMPSWEKGRLIRVCFECKEIFEGDIEKGKS